MDDGFWQCSIATVAVSYQKLLVLDDMQVPRQAYLYKLGNYPRVQNTTRRTGRAGCRSAGPITNVHLPSRVYACMHACTVYILGSVTSQLVYVVSSQSLAPALLPCP